MTRDIGQRVPKVLTLQVESFSCSLITKNGHYDKEVFMHPSGFIQKEVIAAYLRYEYCSSTWPEGLRAEGSSSSSLMELSPS
jgi:hypothetical protein